MSTLQTHFDGHPWKIRVPQLVRYMEKQYIDDFFESGRLRLSSFRACREAEHVGAARQDPMEGRFAGMVGNTAVVGLCGPTAYLLCTSDLERADQARRHDRDSGVRIVRPLEFAQAISHHIKGFSGGELGACAYRDDKWNLTDETPFFPDEANMEASIDKHDRRVSSAMANTLFVKETRFAPEAEWRFIWWTTESQQLHLPIECPDAVRFCRRAMPRRSVI